ncbi:response regulator [Roseimaritima sediminicola]|uniref:response regulator n=1 Tax=Roseimaritima sediminicola TaxID=2662066 RepID=UPI001298398B|nr:hypothetical protein [Roseimaritima sediminicola]
MRCISLQGNHSVTLPSVQAVIVDGRPDDYRTVDETRPANVQLHFLDSGRAALQFALCQPVQLWLVNMHLPDATGVDVLGSLRPRFVGARFFLVADRYVAAEERQARGVGAAGYLCKPPQLWWLDPSKTIDGKHPAAAPSVDSPPASQPLSVRPEPPSRRSPE